MTPLEKALAAAQRAVAIAEQKYQTKERLFDRWIKLLSQDKRYSAKVTNGYNKAEELYLNAQTNGPAIGRKTQTRICISHVWKRCSRKMSCCAVRRLHLMLW